MLNETIDVDLQVSSRWVRSRTADGVDSKHPVELGDALRQELLVAEHEDLARYGRRLFEATFPPGSDGRRTLESAFDRARRGGASLRVRLELDTDGDPGLEGFHWELIDDGRDLALGRSPTVALSRYVPWSSPLDPSAGAPRALCVVAAPTDAQRRGLASIDYDLTVKRLSASFRGSGVQVDFLPRPATAERLRAALVEGRYAVLHIHGHGAKGRGKPAALVLEGDAHEAVFVPEAAVGEIVHGLGHLKLVVLVACHGGAPSSPGSSTSGLAGSLVRRNVPAVVAMRRAITMEAGFQTTQHLYAELGRHGSIDVAVNEVRQRLYMHDSETVDWSSPILAMRARDGRLWTVPPAVDTGSSETEGADGKDHTGEGRTLWRPRPALILLLALVLCLAWPQWYLGAWLALPEIPTWPAEAEPPPPTGPTVPAARPIVPGTVGIGVIRGADGTWEGGLARQVARWFRQRHPALEIALIPVGFRRAAAGVAAGDFGILPGGGEAPGGFERLLLIVTAHGPQATPAPFPTVWLDCGMYLVDARSRRFIVDRADRHLGQDVTEAGALEQALERCLETALTKLPEN